MNISSVWSLVLATTSLQVSLFQSEYKKQDLSKTLKELEPNYGLPKIESFDYIVAGGGSAGCVIAGNLSNAGFSVLLLEKGGDPVPGIMSPFLPSIKFDPAVNDFYKTVPQKHVGGETNHGKELPIPVGRMLGGSGAHNSMTYTRGSPEVYDEWAELLDDPSFSYSGMLKIYKDMENMTGFLLKEEERKDFYGTNGPLSVETDLPSMFGDWFEAGKILGYEAADPNAHLRPSFTTIQTTTRNGIRETSYTAFVQRHPNQKLTIRRFSVVLKVLLEGTSAYGVLYLRHGIAQIALAKSEIIVTAGSLVSPLILLRSGIGPCALLNEAKIPCLVDLPGVGAEVSDQVYISSLKFSLNRRNIPSASDSDTVSFLSTYVGGKGATGAIGLFAFIRSSVSPETGPWPDLRLKMTVDPLIPAKASPQIVLTRPKAKGSLWFNVSALEEGETESTKIVKLNPALLDRREDLEALVEGVTFFFNELLETPQFRAMEFSYDGNLREGCEKFLENSREFWTCFAQKRAGSAGYVVGACRMGRNGDEMRVVDTQFRVIGVERLRIADSSAMPKMANADMNAPTLALAMKAARDILQEVE